MVVFWWSNNITNVKVLWGLKELVKYKAVLFQNSRILTSNRNNYFAKINISFFCVCWVSVCMFSSVERTSVTLLLKWQEIDSMLVRNSRLLLFFQEWGVGMNSIGETWWGSSHWTPTSQLLFLRSHGNTTQTTDVRFQVLFAMFPGGGWY